MLWQVVKSNGTQQQTPEISYSEFLSQVDAGNVLKVTISRNEVVGKYRDLNSFRVIVPANQEAKLQSRRAKNVEIWFRDVRLEGWPAWVMNLAPMILRAAHSWFFMIRQPKKYNRAYAALMFSGELATSTPAPPAGAQYSSLPPLSSPDTSSPKPPSFCRLQYLGQ
jgi:ATP-dependent Zn protease